MKVVSQIAGSRVLLVAIWLLSGIAGCNRKAIPGGARSSAVAVRLQERKVYVFNQGSIVISNRFAAARADTVIKQNDSSFQINILPENKPVNPSPWYAFKIWSSENRNLFITLNYGKEQHRYAPKLSNDGRHWYQGPPVSYNPDSTKVSFAVKVSSDTLIIAAQELMPAAVNQQWVDSLANLPYVHSQVIGYSLQGRPLTAMTTNGSDNRSMVVVLSRQHPPEVTGYMAMQQFVETLMGNSEQAQAFRSRYQLVVVPFINPDGVEEGNWRHSAAGVDLNRDWENFLQPETRAVKAFLLRLVKEQQAKVYFGIDFHSTYKDVFYTNTDTATHIPGFTNRWLKALGKAIPGFRPNVKPSGNGGNVSKSWMMRTLGCDALTYEVGDDTPRDMLKRKGRVAAEQLMALLP